MPITSYKYFFYFSLSLPFSLSLSLSLPHGLSLTLPLSSLRGLFTFGFTSTTCFILVWGGKSWIDFLWVSTERHEFLKATFSSFIFLYKILTWKTFPRAYKKILKSGLLLLKLFDNSLRWQKNVEWVSIYLEIRRKLLGK